jgi:aminomethyltransferase
MGQLHFHGKDRLDFIESIVVGDFKGLEAGNGRLSVMTNTKGGIIDDTVITRQENYLYMVINAGCADKDLVHIRQQLKEWQGKGKDVTMEFLEGQGLIALQGPKAVSVLQSLTSADLSKFAFMSGRKITVAGIETYATRCGYTGEDGFEISVAAKDTEKLARELLKNKDVLSAGLGPRDSLRTEAGLCLYGNDIDETTTPIEAGLAWTIGKRRREQGGFPGAEVILRQLKEGVSRKRVGFLVDGTIAREHTPITLPGGSAKIGEITSGTFSPNLKRAVAIGYIATAQAPVGTQVEVVVRGKNHPATVTKMPFVPTRYFKSA